MGYLLLVLLLAVALGGLGIATLTHRREAWGVPAASARLAAIARGPLDARFAYVCITWLWAGWLAVFGTLFACASIVALVAGATGP